MPIKTLNDITNPLPDVDNTLNSPDEEDINYKPSKAGLGTSLLEGAEDAGISAADDAYGLYSWAKQKLGYQPPPPDEINFHDRAEAKLQETQQTNPNKIAYYGSEFATGTAILAAGTAVTEAGALVAGGGAAIAGSIAESAGFSELGKGLLIGSKAASKFSARLGFGGRLAKTAAISAPGIVGSSVDYDRQGNAYIDPEKMAESTAFVFGLHLFGEGAAAAYRRLTINKGSFFDSASKNLSALHEKIQRSSLKSSKSTEKTKSDDADENEETHIEEPNIKNEETYNNNEVQVQNKPDMLDRSVEYKESLQEDQAADIARHSIKIAEMDDSFINANFEENELEKIIKPLDQRNETIASDVRFSKDALDAESRMHTGISESAKNEYRNALIHKYGLRVNGIDAHISEPAVRAYIYDQVDNVKATLARIGAVRVATTIKTLQAIKKLSKARREKYESLIDALFDKKPYRNLGSINNPEAGLTEDAPSGLYYYNLKGNKEVFRRTAQARNLYEDTSDIGGHLNILSELTHWGYARDSYKSWAKTLRRAADNPMSLEDAERVISDHDNNIGIFERSARDFTETDINKTFIESGDKFLDPDSKNAFFVKALAKLQQNSKAAQAFINCVIGF